MSEDKTKTAKKRAPATKPPAKPAKAGPTKATLALLGRIKTDTAQIDKLRGQLERLQSRNDANVVKARGSGLKFHEIATGAGRSVSWVQAAIRRATKDADPKPASNGSESDSEAPVVDAASAA